MKSCKDTAKKLVRHDLLIPVILFLLFGGASLILYRDQRQEGASVKELLTDINFMAFPIVALIILVSAAVMTLRYVIRFGKLSSAFGERTLDETVKGARSFEDVHFFCDDVFVSLEIPAAIRYDEIASMKSKRTASSDDGGGYSVHYSIDIFTKGGKRYRLNNFRSKNRSYVSEEENFRSMVSLFMTKNPDIELDHDVPSNMRR